MLQKLPPRAAATAETGGALLVGGSLPVLGSKAETTLQGVEDEPRRRWGRAVMSGIR
jgi:hypothetical protein